MNNLDVQALRRIFDLLQTHFPERLSELWFLNAPWIFWGALARVSCSCPMYDDTHATGPSPVVSCAVAPCTMCGSHLLSRASTTGEPWVAVGQRLRVRVVTLQST